MIQQETTCIAFVVPTADHSPGVLPLLLFTLSYMLRRVTDGFPQLFFSSLSPVSPTGGKGPTNHLFLLGNISYMRRGTQDFVCLTLKVALIEVQQRTEGEGITSHTFF